MHNRSPHQHAISRGSSDAVSNGHNLKPAALDAANLGIGVFRGRDKLPATPHGLLDATTDPARIETINWTAPRATLCGLSPVTIIVWDADDPRLVEELQQAYPEFRRAPLVRTPRVGGHFYMRMAEGVPAPATGTKVNGQPLDVRGNGKAYVLLPPSVLSSGGAYTWERQLTSLETLPVITAALLEALIPPKRGSDRPATLPAPKCTERLSRYIWSAVQGEHDTVAAAQEGTRNHTLNVAAVKLGSLVGTGVLAEQDAIDALLAASRVCGLPEWEARKTIESGMRYGILHPRQLETAPA
jgi:hypothetical protein